MLSQDIETGLPGKSPEELKAELRNVNKELTVMRKQWQEEKRRLLGDKAALQDAASRLNTEMREAQRQAGNKERADKRVRAYFFFWLSSC